LIVWDFTPFQSWSKE